MIKKILFFGKKHKITFFVVLLALIASGYFGYTQIKKTNITTSTYQVAKVEKGSIKTVVSGTGQVGDANQINISPEVSGEITKIAVSLNQEVHSGDLLAEIDSSDLNNQIYQAQLAIKSAQLNLDKMKEPVDEADITKAENELIAAQNEFIKLKLTQEHEMDVAKEEKKNAPKDSAELKAAKRKIEELELSQPMAISEQQAKIEQLEQALDKTKEGTSSDEIELQELSIKEKQSQLNDLYDQQADYTITAPKDGVIALINYKEGEKFSGGNTSSDSSALIVLLSKIKNATLAINEVDVPSISVGQKVDLTFDALLDLQLAGTVTQIDQIGIVTSNVVSNGVTIAFDQQDDRIKNGMTVNADIIISAKDDIIIVPTSALKTQNNQTYVQMKNSDGVKMAAVEIGIADDTSTEIISGLSQGDVIVTKTITAESTNSSKNTNTASSKENNSLFDMGGSGGPPEMR